MHPELKQLAKRLKRENPDWTMSHCYAVATNKARQWCAVSTNPEVKAKWCAVAATIGTDAKPS